MFVTRLAPVDRMLYYRHFLKNISSTILPVLIAVPALMSWFLLAMQGRRCICGGAFATGGECCCGVIPV